MNCKFPSTGFEADRNLSDRIVLVMLTLLLVFSRQPSAFSQGSLTPPGPPAPTMKTLDQIEPRMPVSSLPVTITNPGSYYLTGNLTGIAGANGITIAANDVSLDLNGFALIGVGGSQDGIGYTGFGTQTNLTVRNGTIRNWGGSGIRVLFFYNCQFRDLMIETNGAGGLLAGNNSIIHHCQAIQNGGEGIDGAFDSLITECVALDNTADGIHAGQVIVRNSGASYNGGAGIYVYTGSQVVHCQALNNTLDGIVLGYYSHAIENTCAGNNPNGNAAKAGIRTFYDGGRIDGNHVQYDNGTGIMVVSGLKWLVIRNSTVGATNNAYSIPAGNDVGPLGKAATSTSPWANIYN